MWDGTSWLICAYMKESCLDVHTIKVVWVFGWLIFRYVITLNSMMESSIEMLTVDTYEGNSYFLAILVSKELWFAK
jgi:hypothetical protein